MTFSDKVISLGGASGFGGAWLWSERIGGELMAAVMVMAGTFLFGALAWRAELWSPRAVAGSLARSAPKREKVAAPLFAILLLSSAVGAPVGTVAAATTTEDCSGVDAMIYDMVTVGEYSLADQEEHPCSPAFQRAQAIEDLTNASATQEELDIYNAGLSQRANNDVFDSVSNNYMNDSRSTAWMHAESTLAECYQDGKSKAVCKSEAQTAIADYYSKMHINMIERWNVTAQSGYRLWKTADNQTGISSEFVDYRHGSDTGADSRIKGIKNITTTLPNGSTHGVKALVVNSNFDGNTNNIEEWFSPGESGYDQTYSGGPFSGGAEIFIKSPDANHEQVVYINMAEWRTRDEKINQLNTDLQNEVDPFVNTTWTAFQSGEINASDLISRNNLMFRYGTDALNNTNQSLYDSTAALASMGLASPNLSSTGSMTVEYQNVTYTGMVLAQEAPGGSWQTGTTYNTSNIGGVVLLATTDGERIDMKGEFTLTEMKNQDGENINETSATKVVYQTANTSELLDKMARILELRAQVESTKPKAGSGSTTSDGSSLLDQLAALLGISAGAAAVVLVGVGVLVFKFYSP